MQLPNWNGIVTGHGDFVVAAVTGWRERRVVVVVVVVQLVWERQLGRGSLWRRQILGSHYRIEEQDPRPCLCMKHGGRSLLQWHIAPYIHHNESVTRTKCIIFVMLKVKCRRNRFKTRLRTFPNMVIHVIMLKKITSESLVSNQNNFKNALFGYYVQTLQVED